MCWISIIIYYTNLPRHCFFIVFKGSSHRCKKKHMLLINYHHSHPTRNNQSHFQHISNIRRFGGRMDAMFASHIMQCGLIHSGICLFKISTVEWLSLCLVFTRTLIWIWVVVSGLFVCLFYRKIWRLSLHRLSYRDCVLSDGSHRELAILLKETDHHLSYRVCVNSWTIKHEPVWKPPLNCFWQWVKNNLQQR